MNKLKPLNNRHLFHLKEIIDGKSGDRKTYLLKKKSTLDTFYTNYATCLSSKNLESITVSGLNLKSKLAKYSLHCYNVSGKALIALKSEIRANQVALLEEMCPYCGIGDSAQFDHYIPKKKYPEYAVHALNLIPCCSTCNGKKHETWLVNGKRVYLNFYSDSIPTAKFLFASISWRIKNGVAVPTADFTILRPSGFSKSSFEILKEHFDRLELLTRYRRRTSAAYFNILAAAKMQPTKSAAVVKNRLARFISLQRNNLGPNHWQIALMEELIQDATFIGQCLK